MKRSNIILLTVLSWTWLLEFCICWTKVRIVLRIKVFPPMSTTICVCQEWNTEKAFPRSQEEGNMFLWQHSIPQQRRIKTLFQYNLTSQKMLLGRRAELSYDAPVKFCIGEVLWAMPKRNGVFFWDALPYWIKLTLCQIRTLPKFCFLLYCQFCLLRFISW